MKLECKEKFLDLSEKLQSSEGNIIISLFKYSSNRFVFDIFARGVFTSELGKSA